MLQFTSYIIHRLVIGLTTGLAIVDTVNCKCLLVEVDEIDFMGELCEVRTEGTSVESTVYLGHKTVVILRNVLDLTATL